MSIFSRLFGKSPPAADVAPAAGWDAGVGSPPPDPSRQALASLCQALLGSNRYLYLE